MIYAARRNMNKGTQRRERDWLIAPPHPERERLAEQAGVAPLVAQVLLLRGLTDPGEVRSFLTPDFRALYPPDSLPGAAAAATRLIHAVQKGRRIVIYGDYDVDGVTATTILWHVLRLAGAKVDSYIPSRLEEGYGLSREALERIAADGGQTVITVDCGITALDEAEFARSLGLELIITDHHQPRSDEHGRPRIPAADCVVHPTALTGASLNPDLSGAGVALKVAWSLAQQLGGATRVTPQFRDFLLEATGFAALGLIADVVPLTGENRIIASFGLQQLCLSKNPGLQALIDVSGLTGKRDMNDTDVGFLLAPRLNAVGRMGHAELAVELFTRADAARARDIAAILDRHNRDRQAVERTIFKQAEGQVRQLGFDLEACRAIVLADAGWHVGVIGIVASRLVERFSRPTILIALNGENGSAGEGQGSGRSVRNFPLHEALAACDGHLLSHGGHAMAAGVRIRADRVDDFTQAFQAEAARRLTAVDLRPKLHLDDEVPLTALTADVVRLLERLAPFGTGNRRPLFCTPEVELVDEPRIVGKAAQHLQFTVRQPADTPATASNSSSGLFSDGGRASANGAAGYRKAIGFNMADYADELSARRRFRLAFEPLINEWNGQTRVELKIVDVKF